MPLSDRDLRDRLAATTRFDRMVHVARCASTQELAVADIGADAGGPDGRDAVFWADHQTAGRGRQQRVWHDEPGADLAVTFRVTAQLPTPLALPVVVPVLVHEVLASRLGARAEALRVKWPNDVLLGERKLAGVLIDVATSRPMQYAIGVGINLNGMSRPPELAATATSLKLATGRDHDRTAVLLDLAMALDGALAQLVRGDTAPFAARFRDALGLMGRRVVVRAADAAAGRLVALDLDALRLDDGRAFPLGQVRELRAE
ncbi:MAG: biotin--[acetyl-CoA-carboxylase] ligase [Planctomycetota bacterium]